MVLSSSICPFIRQDVSRRHRCVQRGTNRAEPGRYYSHSDAACALILSPRLRSNRGWANSYVAVE